jgi:glycosyltransferase involved in cell wall biosynthesis
MRILYLNHNVAWSGGTFFRALPCAASLVARGHDVTLLSISPRRRWGYSRVEHQGVQVVETPDLFWGRGRSGWDPWDVWSRLAALRNGRNWDIVHSWDCRPVAILPALWARRLAQRQPARLLTDWADWWGRGGTQGERAGSWMRAIWPIETYFEEVFRARADGTTTISTALRDRALALGLPADRIRVLRQGCTPVADRPRIAARARLGLPPDQPLIVYVGRLMLSDATLLFGTVSRILARWPTCRFAMIGNHGTRIPADLAGHARFTAPGVVEATVLADYVAACDLSLAPLANTLANRARWPSKVNGFLSAGRATVLTNVGDLPAMLQNAGAALVTTPDVDALVAGVEHLLDNDEHRARVEKAARIIAGGELSWTRIAGELEQFYRAL